MVLQHVWLFIALVECEKLVLKSRNRRGFHIDTVSRSGQGLPGTLLSGWIKELHDAIYNPKR